MFIFSIDMDIVIYLLFVGLFVGYCLFNIIDKGMDEWREDKSDFVIFFFFVFRFVIF